MKQSEHMMEDEEKVRKEFGSILKEEQIEHLSAAFTKQKQYSKEMQETMKVRKLLRGKYFQRVTPQYELILEYHQQTLHISLYTVREKNYFLFVQNEGKYRLQNGLFPLDIFEAFKESPEICAVNHYEGILVLETKYSVGKREKIQRKEVKMEETELREETKLKVEFSRKMRKFLQQKRRQDEELREKFRGIIKKSEEQQKKHKNQIQESDILFEIILKSLS